MKNWCPPVVIQKGDITDTVVSFDPRQRGSKPTYHPRLHWNICWRYCIWVADFDSNGLTRSLFCGATENRYNDYR